MKITISPRAAAKPVLVAAVSPAFSCRMTRTLRAKRRMMSRERSVEPSSTTITSTGS
jgi:hypothetical protein